MIGLASRWTIIRKLEVIAEKYDYITHGERFGKRGHYSIVLSVGGLLYISLVFVLKIYFRI